jgi:hypothetical protein
LKNKIKNNNNKIKNTEKKAKRVGIDGSGPHAWFFYKSLYKYGPEKLHKQAQVFLLV